MSPSSSVNNHKRKAPLPSADDLDDNLAIDYSSDGSSTSLNRQSDTGEQSDQEQPSIARDATAQSDRSKTKATKTTKSKSTEKPQASAKDAKRQKKTTAPPSADKQHQIIHPLAFLSLAEQMKIMEDAREKALPGLSLLEIEDMSLKGSLIERRPDTYKKDLTYDNLAEFIKTTLPDSFMQELADTKTEPGKPTVIILASSALRVLKILNQARDVVPLKHGKIGKVGLQQLR